MRPRFSLPLAVLPALLGPGAPAEAAPGGDERRAPEVSLADLAERPQGRFTRRCSILTDVCVHAPDGLPEGASADVLAIAERSLLGLGALKLPLPNPDTPRGGDGRLDIYLSGTGRATAHGDPGSAGTGFDSATAFVVGPARSPVGCADAQAIADAVSRTSLLGLDAALEPSALGMLAGHAATILEPCTVAEQADVAIAQSTPERTFLGEYGEAAPASFLFPKFLEDKYGTGEPGKLTFALAAIAAQRSGAGPLVDEPDAFDALRLTQQRNGTSIADTLLELAVARAFVGSRSDETQMIDVAKYGDFGRVRFEWAVKHESLPRRLAQTRPVEPLGAAYLWLDLEKAKENAEVTFIFEWEEPVAFRWAIVKVDAQGSPVATFDVVPVLGQTKIEKTVRNLSGARGLVIVGLNEGEGRRDEPFDPGRRREPPHGWVVSLYP